MNDSSIDYSDFVKAVKDRIVIFHYFLLFASVITFIVAAITIFCIVYTSPRTLGTYRWYLLSIVVSSFAEPLFTTIVL